jgi:hypothetical protein
MKKIVLAATTALALSLIVPCASFAQTPAAATAKKPYYSVEESTIGELLDNPATKAILMKHAPALFGNEGISQAAGLTLKALQQYAADMLPDDLLAKIDADLKTVPAPKS